MTLRNRIKIRNANCEEIDQLIAQLCDIRAELQAAGAEYTAKIVAAMAHFDRESSLMRQQLAEALAELQRVRMMEELDRIRATFRGAELNNAANNTDPLFGMDCLRWGWGEGQEMNPPNLRPPRSSKLADNKLNILKAKCDGEKHNEAESSFWRHRPRTSSLPGSTWQEPVEPDRRRV
jgi:hypothetical protein